METKSTIINLPIMPYNQSKHSDVCQHLDYLQDFLVKLQANVPNSHPGDINVIEKDFTIPLFGDQFRKRKSYWGQKNKIGM